MLGINTLRGAPASPFPACRSLPTPPGRTGIHRNALAQAGCSSHAPYLPNPRHRLHFGADKGLPDPEQAVRCRFGCITRAGWLPAGVRREKGLQHPAGSRVLPHTGLCSLPPRPGLLAGSPSQGPSRECVSKPPSSLEGKFIMETKAMLSPSGAFPVPFPPELPAEVPRERARTPRPGRTAGKLAGGHVCFGHCPAARCSAGPALPWGTQPGCSGILLWQS